MLQISPTRYLRQIIIDARDEVPRISFDIYVHNQMLGRPVAQCWMQGDLGHPILSDILNKSADYIRQLLEGIVNEPEPTGPTGPTGPNSDPRDPPRELS